MHLHLLDIPKPKCAPHRRSVVALSLVFAACAAMPLLCKPRPRSVFIPYRLSHPKEQSPVQYVTVRTITEYSGAGGCGRVSISTHQKPLMELFDELCKNEVEAVAGYCIPLNAQQQEQKFLQVTEEFAAKYSLTLEQVTMIKWEGKRLKQEAGE